MTALTDCTCYCDCRIRVTPPGQCGDCSLHHRSIHLIDEVPLVELAHPLMYTSTLALREEIEWARNRLALSTRIPAMPTNPDPGPVRHLPLDPEEERRESLRTRIDDLLRISNDNAEMLRERDATIEALECEVAGQLKTINVRSN